MRVEVSKHGLEVYNWYDRPLPHPSVVVIVTACHVTGLGFMSAKVSVPSPNQGLSIYVPRCHLSGGGGRQFFLQHGSILILEEKSRRTK